MLSSPDMTNLGLHADVMSRWALPQSNLQKFDLPYPEAVFEINYFRENPNPCKSSFEYVHSTTQY